MSTIRWNSSQLTEIEKRLSAAIYQEGLTLITSSIPNVPVDTGTLRSTGFTQQPSVSGEKITVKAGYGGPATKINPHTGEASTDYAVKVHEDLNMQHKVGSAKFLERPARALSQKFSANIKRRMKI
jgi:hypothetical protein